VKSEVGQLAEGCSARRKETKECRCRVDRDPPKIGPLIPVQFKKKKKIGRSCEDAGGRSRERSREQTGKRKGGLKTTISLNTSLWGARPLLCIGFN